MSIRVWHSLKLLKSNLDHPNFENDYTTIPRMTIARTQDGVLFSKLLRIRRQKIHKLTIQRLLYFEKKGLNFFVAESAAILKTGRHLAFAQSSFAESSCHG